MPIYTFRCNVCGTIQEKLVKTGQTFTPCTTCQLRGDPTNWNNEMQQVPSVPAPMQWGCRKGF